MSRVPEKIVMVTADYPPALSGIGDYTFQLVRHLQLLDPAPEVTVTTEWRGEPFRRVIETSSPDIVHFQYMTSMYQDRSEACFLPRNVKRMNPSVRVVTTYHEFAAPWKRLALWPLLRNSDAHVVTNQRHLGFLEMFSKAGILKGTFRKIGLGTTVFPCTPDAGRRAQIRSQLKIKEGEFLFVRFGIVHDVILPELIRLAGIFKQAREAGLPVRLLMIGKAEPRAERRLREKCGDGILFEKDLSHEMLSQYLRASDAGIALYPDGVSEKRTALLSFFSHGLPVLATRRGVLPREFREGENMICVPVRANQSAWTAAISQLVSDVTLRARLSEGALKVAADHSWSSIAAQTFQLYGELLP